MTNFFQFSILGLGVGAGYALLSQTTDFSPYAFKIKSLGADAVWMNTAFALSIGIMKAAVQIGLKPTWRMFGSRAFFTIAQNGSLVPQSKLPPVDGLTANHLR